MFSLNTITTKVSLNDDQLLKLEEYGVTTIDAAFLEMVNQYPQVQPYEKIPLLDGPCFKWSDSFIDKCLLAMATDKMTQFDAQELIIWQFFVNFENYHSHSAKDTDANGAPVGCTNPNELFESFVVGQHGLILDGKDGGPLQYCQPPGYEVESEEIWSSLDKAFMSLYNCQPVNDCLVDDGMQEQPCTQ